MHQVFCTLRLGLRRISLIQPALLLALFQITRDIIEVSKRRKIDGIKRSIRAFIARTKLFESREDLVLLFHSLVKEDDMNGPMTTTPNNLLNDGILVLRWSNCLHNV